MVIFEYLARKNKVGYYLVQMDYDKEPRITIVRDCVIEHPLAKHEQETKFIQTRLDLATENMNKYRNWKDEAIKNCERLNIELRKYKELKEKILTLVDNKDMDDCDIFKEIKKLCEEK